MPQYETLWSIEWTPENATNNGLPRNYGFKHEDHKPATIEYLVPNGDYDELLRVLDRLGQVIQTEVIRGDARISQ
jgi:hypothetical protein